jgi:membrane protease YdiL (CAAX protease family)
MKQARPNIVLLIVLLYWLFAAEVFLPHIMPMIEGALGIEPIIGFAWSALSFFVRWGVPIVGYLVYLLIAKKRILPAFSMARLSGKNILYIVIFTMAIRAVDLLATRFIPFAVSPWQLQIGWSLGQALIVGAVFAAIYEELNFRGYLHSEYRNQKIPIWKTALVTGLFFGAIHSGFAVFTAGLFGVMWAYMLYYTRSIWAPLLSHFIYNALGSLLNPAYYANNQADYTRLMQIFLMAIAIAAAVLIPTAIICIKRFFKENRHNAVKKSDLPKEGKTFTITYWLLIAAMIVVIFIFRI